MKNILKSFAFLVLLGFFSGCAEDYLETKPTSSTGAATAFESTQNAAMVINGICKHMTRQYLSSQGFNGEGTIKMYYGNYPGNNFVVNLPGWAAIINPTYHENITSTYCYYPWYYYYRLVGDGNSVIANIDAADGPENEKQFIKAQALTFRAYAFTMLAQLYGYRWSDSNNGATSGVVLRLEPTSDPMPLSTLGQTYEQIYADLDEAIDLYTKSGLKRSANYLPDISVAYAVYARAAINKLDYAKAAETAIKARADYPLMTVAEYKSGFSNVNQEWIWSSYGASDETLYYYSYHAYIGYNSNAGAVRTTPKCITRGLYETIPATDIRKGLFLDPNLVGGTPYSTTTGAATAALKAKAIELFPKVDASFSAFAWMQFKIACNDNPGVAHLNHFRSSEMYLIEAEALYKQGGNDSRVQQLLVDLTKNSGRDPQYTCTQTGESLFAELKRIAQIELWGEGFDWFLLKRWGDEVDHRSFADGGNYPTGLVEKILPADKNKWTWLVPLRETDYNPLAKNGN
jgi:hypothetical protein